ncbi:MAG: creatininase family protein [bacterium]|jgi:creatinine amidohydrolase
MPEAETEKRVAIGDLTWMEIEERKDKVQLVIIPVGSTEQHGPHLCLATDATRAYKFSLRVARALYPRVLVAPGIPVGISPHHLDFPGTITLRPQTLVDTIVDYVASLRQHGFQRFLIINAHGGNEGTLAVAVEAIRAQFGLRVPYVNYKVMTADVTKEVVTSGRIEHSGEWEVSDAWFLAPELVRPDALSKGGEGAYPFKYTDLYGQFRVGYPYRWKDLTNNGAMGDARAASPEKGKKINDTALERIVEFIEDFIKG